MGQPATNAVPLSPYGSGVRVTVMVPPAQGAEAFTAGSSSHPDMRRWTPLAGSADADLLPELGTIRSRSRDLARNHGVADGAQQTLVDNIVGSGLRLKSRPLWKALGWTQDQAEEWSNGVEALWSIWSESNWCDAARALNFHGLTTQAYRAGFVNGEALALPLWLPKRVAAGAPAATCIQLVEADRLANPNHQPDSDRLRGGIEIDEYGGAVAYWIRKTHPGDRYWLSTGFSSDAERIPAFTPWGRMRVIHVHDKERTGQSRGKPGLASVLRQFKVLGDYTNAELKAAVVNSMVAMVTESAVGQEGLVELLAGNPDALKSYQDGLANRGRSGIDFNAGMIVPLALGEKLNSFTPGRPSTAFEPFVLSLFRHVAAGLNLPYELLLKDFSKTNYSSARAALLEAWRFFKGRRKWIATYWAQPVFELWFEEMVQQGAIEAPDFYAKRALYCRAKWLGDGRGWIDPLKEAQAAEKRMTLGLTNLEDESAEQGQDWEEQLEQRAREEARARELGVTLPWMNGGGGSNAAPAEPDADEGDPEDPASATDGEGRGSDAEEDRSGGGDPGARQLALFATPKRAAKPRAAAARASEDRLDAMILQLAGELLKPVESLER